MEYLILGLLWSIWCIIHSGMISLTVTNYLKKRLGDYFRFYRLFYNLVSLTTLVIIIPYSTNLKGQVLFRWDGYWMIVQLSLLIIVIILLISGGRKYDMLQFLGLRQITSGRSYSTLNKTDKIDISGILNITRHPWYLGAIIFIWIDFKDLYVSTLIINVILTIYLVIGTILEERKLINEYGDKYRDYKVKVSMLFPIKWLSSKISMSKK